MLILFFLYQVRVPACAFWLLSFNTVALRRVWLWLLWTLTLGICRQQWAFSSSGWTKPFLWDSSCTYCASAHLPNVSTVCTLSIFLLLPYWNMPLRESFPLWNARNSPLYSVFTNGCLQPYLCVQWWKNDASLRRKCPKYCWPLFSIIASLRSFYPYFRKYGKQRSHFSDLTMC